jgi:hypothetical protein
MTHPILRAAREPYEAAIQRLFERTLAQAVRRRDEGLYGFVFYGASGLRVGGVAYSTRAAIRKAYDAEAPARARMERARRTDPALAALAAEYGAYFDSLEKFEVEACNWPYSGSAGDLGAIVDFWALDDAGVDSTGWIEQRVMRVFSTLKSGGAFSSPPFEEHVLLGIQQPEPGDLDLVERTSATLSSPAWHDKVETYCREQRRVRELEVARVGRKATKQPAKKAAKKR